MSENSSVPPENREQHLLGTASSAFSKDDASFEGRQPKSDSGKHAYDDSDASMTDSQIKQDSVDEMNEAEWHTGGTAVDYEVYQDPQESGLESSDLTPQYDHMNAEELNSAYLNAWRELVVYLCALYARRYPERCLVTAQEQDDMPIASSQLARALYDDDMFFSSTRLTEENDFFSRQGIPEHDEIMSFLVSHSEMMSRIRNAAESAHKELVIERIRMAFDLRHEEMMLLMAVALGAMDNSVYRAMAFAYGNATAKKFRASFICELVGFNREAVQHNMELLSDRGQLIRMRLIIPERSYGFSGLLPRAFAELAVDQRVLDALQNANLTANLSPHMHLYDQAQRRQSLVLSKEFMRQLKLLIAQPRARILLTGAAHSGRRTAACSFAKSVLKKNVIAVDFVSEIETLEENDIENHFCNYLREALLLDAVLLFRFDGLKSGSFAEKKLDNLQPPLSRHVEYFPGTLIITSEKSSQIISRLFNSPVECHINLPTPAEQYRVWNESLAGIFEDKELERIASSFSNNYQLTVGQILQTVRRSLDAHDLRCEVDPESKLESHHILEEIRQCFSHDLDTLADVILSNVPIERVILPEATSKTIKEILDFARYQRVVLDDWGYRKCSAYGNSLSILFTGPPGTGKTLLATAMAHELGKILYRVDLSRIVDKYVGETEKNLAKIFDEAAKAQAILLFDEADSLFAKRTDVKSSNDRYANLEVNFLIQKLESYQGISILTTNLQSSIDEAFKRRLRYIVDFKEPNMEERIQLWKALIAPNTPLKDDINWRILSENFELSGGHIRNATLNASIRAAAKGEALGMQYLLEAAIAETQKLGKLVKLSDKVLLILDEYGVEIL